jgi:ABC-type Na+ efflux pump permease subunit
MTTVGKILVIVIMLFAVLFLGISTVVFTTATNWKEATAAQKKKVQELDAKNRDLLASVDAAKKDLDKAVADHQAAKTQAEGHVKSLEDENKTLSQEATAARSKLEVAQQSAHTSLTQAEERRKETEVLREQKSAVEKQANEFKLQQTELNDKIRDLERQSKTLDENNKDLRDRVARYSTALRKAGLSDDVSTYRGLESPPPVQGEVSRVDAQNRKVEITIGSDDGLVPGHELFLYRTKPRAEYLGKIKILSVDPDQAVGKVIGNTVQGKKIQEGDIVSSTIRPRS